MSAKEETHKNTGFGFCHSLMSNCCNPGSTEEKAGKFDFKSCEQIMKQFCGDKDGKCDFEAFRSKIAEYCKGAHKKADGKENN